jgi:RNA polymerase sigma factor (sigma-70 family)
MVKRTGRRDLFDDFYSAACEAVVEAAASYDPERGASAKTWLTNAAVHRIVDYIRVEMGRRPGSMRQHEAPYSTRDDVASNESNSPYYSPFSTRPDPAWQDLFNEVDDADEDARALAWAGRVLSEELSEAHLAGVRAWVEHRKLKAAGESIGRTESWVCRCVQEAERVLREKSRERGLQAPREHV